MLNYQPANQPVQEQALLGNFEQLAFPHYRPLSHETPLQLPRCPVREKLIREDASAFFRSIPGQVQKVHEVLEQYLSALQRTEPNSDIRTNLLNPTFIANITDCLGNLMLDVSYAPLPKGLRAEASVEIEFLSTQLESLYNNQLNNEQEQSEFERQIQFTRTHIKRCFDIMSQVSRYDLQRYVICCIDQDKQDLSIRLDTLLAMTKTEAILLDVDDCLIASEHIQESVWCRAIDLWIRDVVARDPNAPTSVADLLKKSIKHSFETGEMRELAPRLFDLANNYGVLPMVASPEGSRLAQDTRELEGYLLLKRIPPLCQAAREGDIFFLPGALRLLKNCYQKKIPVGIYTSAPEKVANQILHILIEKNADGLSYEQLIPSRFRVFGDQLPVGANKPAPDGWLLGAQRLGYHADKVLVVDDRSNTLAGAARAKQVNGSVHQFGGVVGLFHRPEEIDTWLGWIGREDFDPKVHRILIRNLDSVE